MFGHLPVVFDSASTAERDQIGSAREEYRRRVLKVELEVSVGTLSKTPFRLRICARSYGGVQVAVIRGTPHRIVRTQPLIDDGDDRIGLMFAIAGRFGGEQGGRTVEVGRGEATVLIADQTGWFGTPSGGALLIIMVSPAELQTFARAVKDRAGYAVCRSSMSFELLRGYLSTLNRGHAEIPRNVSDVAGRHIAEIASHAITAGAPTEASGPPGAILRASRLAAAHAHMSVHFTDPNYDVAACAGHVGVSVRSLQAILEADGTRFGENLRRLRLDHARRMLVDQANRGVRVTDIALECGFSDIANFNRQFRASFQESPTSARGEREGGVP